MSQESKLRPEAYSEGGIVEGTYEIRLASNSSRAFTLAV